MSKCVTVLILSILCTLVLGCQNTRDNENVDIDKLVDLLVGEFDSSAQMRNDQLLSLDKEESHGWVNRNFIEVNAPQVGSHVLVGSTRYGGPPWTFEKHTDGEGIVMSPRRFKDLHEMIPHALNAEKLSDFSPSDLEAARSGAACDIVWTKSENGFIAQSEPCYVMSVVHNKLLDWQWSYELTPDALWISYNGVDEEGSVLDSTPTDNPYRLDRIEGGAEYSSGRNMLLDARDRDEITKAAEMLELAVIDQPENADARLKLVYAYTRLGRYKESEPHLAEANNLRGTLSENAQLWLEALDARVADDTERELSGWEALAEAKKNDRWVWYELASSQYRMEHFSDAVGSIERALAAEPDELRWGSTYIYYLHSKSLFRVGNFQAAIDAAEPGIRNVNTRRATFYRKAMAQIASGQDVDIHELLATYREYSVRNGTLNEAVLNTSIALFFFELSEYDKAVEYARAGFAISQGPYQSWALGYALTEAGEPETGLEIITQALDTYPGHASLLAGQGWAYYRLGSYERAQEALLAARAASERKNSGIERDIRVVEEALSSDAYEQIPPVRWFGD